MKTSQIKLKSVKYIPEPDIPLRRVKATIALPVFNDDILKTLEKKGKLKLCKVSNN